MEMWEDSVRRQGHVCSQTSASGFHQAIPPLSLPFRRAVPEHGSGASSWGERSQRVWAGSLCSRLKCPHVWSIKGQVGCGASLSTRAFLKCFTLS